MKIQCTVRYSSPHRYVCYARLSYCTVRLYGRLKKILLKVWRMSQPCTGQAKATEDVHASSNESRFRLLTTSAEENKKIYISRLGEETATKFLHTFKIPDLVITIALLLLKASVLLTPWHGNSDWNSPLGSRDLGVDRRSRDWPVLSAVRMGEVAMGASF